MKYTIQKTFEIAKKNCPIGGTAFSCMPTCEAMRKGRKTKIGYVSAHLSASEIYLALNGVALESGNPVLIFHK